MITQRFHYIFDAWDLSAKKLNDKKIVKNLLQELAGICKMKIISGPLVIDGMDYNPGISGFCIIDFSHISIHTFSKPKEICVDIFSCRPFDPIDIKKHLIKKLQAKATKLHYFQVLYPNQYK